MSLEIDSKGRGAEEGQPGGFGYSVRPNETYSGIPLNLINKCERKGCRNLQICFF